MSNARHGDGTASRFRAVVAVADLETRVENRKRELIAEIVWHKKNSLRACAAEAIDRAEARLFELAHIVKEGGVGGGARVRPTARLRLNEWMTR